MTAPLIRAALALWRANGKPMKPTDGWWAKVQPESMDLDPFIEQARAALEAIREPSDAQITSVSTTPQTQIVAKHNWKTMIDAALMEE